MVKPCRRHNLHLAIERSDLTIWRSIVWCFRIIQQAPSARSNRRLLALDHPARQHNDPKSRSEPIE
jgi:hypothetical protein